MKTHARLLLVALLLAASAAPAAAAASDGVIQLDQVDVTATPILAVRLLLEESRLHDAAPFTGTTRDDFEHRPNNRAGDILKRLPGVFMGGPPGERNDVRLRGLDKEFTRTQLDGLQLPDGGEKRELQFDRLPAHFVESVTILRSPTAEFESDGLAGRVSVTSAAIPAHFTGRFRAAWGERNTSSDGLWHLSAHAGGRPLPWLGLQGTLSYFDDPVVKTKHEQTSASDGTAGKSLVETERKRLVARDGYAKIATTWTGGLLELRPLRLELQERKVKEKAERDPAKPVANDEAVEHERERKTKRTDGGVLFFSHRLERGGTVDSTAGWHRTSEFNGDKRKQSFKETAGALAPDKFTAEVEDKADATRDLKLNLAAPLGRGGILHRTKAGFAFRDRDRFRAKSVLETDARGKVTDKTTPKDTYFLGETYAAAYAQDAIAFGERFTLLPGVRVERVGLASRDRVSAEIAHSRTDVNPSLHALWRFGPQTVLKAAAARAVNRAKFDELSPYETEAADKFIRGHPALRPSTAHNFDLSLEHARRDAFVGLNLFHKRIAGVIEEAYTGETRGHKRVYQVLNVGDGWTRGAELEQRLTFGWTGLRALRGLTLWGNQTLLASAYTDATGRTQRFKEQPRFLANAGVDWELGRLIVTASAQHRGRRSHWELADRRALGAETVYDLALRTRLAAGASLFVEIANLTDESRRETLLKADGSTTAKWELGGRSLQAGVAYAF